MGFNPHVHQKVISVLRKSHIAGGKVNFFVMLSAVRAEQFLRLDSVFECN